ncbi:MAG: aldehyde dehydrogenase EutE [Lachnospiraceae bacterium]|nr:aldehyde dehydrogenase family protein [uncultured Schaedlerella sp.]MCX4315575.1 aldehyde dehydrogenase EutE [Lachnospiraceae bacterium]
MSVEGNALQESVVQEIVSQVMAKLQIAEAPTGKHGIFADMNEAIEAAKKAQRVMRNMSMDQREEIIANIRRMTKEQAEIMARMGVQETGMGNVGHKILKHQLVAEKTPGTEDITTTAWSGDRGLTLIEMGPFGVIGAITPCTNPSETILCNSMGMIAGGNTVVFNPHPAAIKTSIYAINLINEASLAAGGPDNVACTVEKPTLETSNIMMKHPDIPLIAATGGPGVVTAVLSSGKRGIGAGAGNPPAVVDETADIRKAAGDIVNGCTFDNNLPCIAEKEVVAVETVIDELIHYMVTEQGCYLASKEEQERLTATVLTPKGLNRKCVGRDAKTLLGMIGVTVPDNIRCIIFEGEKEHPLISEELMMPILGIVRAKDFDDAVEKAVWLEHGNRHSAHIHSKNIDHITKYAKAIDTAILVKNGPSYSALGFGGEGFCTFTIASRTGEGLTSASTFTKRRRCVMSDSLCIR